MQNEQKLALVSIVMPAYNANQYIDQAIASILNQSYTKLELLIVDDCSTDNTLQIIRKFDDTRIRVYQNEQNLGYLKSCNLLLEKTKGEYITFQDADDYSATDRIEKLVNFLVQNKDYGLCGSNFMKVDETNQPLGASKYPTEHTAIYNRFPDEVPFCGAACMITRKVYHKIGGYQTFFDRMGAEDHDWLMRIAESFSAKNLNEALYYYRYNPNSIGGDWSDNYRKMFSKKLIAFLFNQRKDGGLDGLTGGDKPAFDRYYQSLEQPYLDDPSLLLANLARREFYSFSKKRALNYARRALKKRFSLKNLRDYIYYWRNQ